MNIDLLPFSSFLLESCGTGPAVGEAHTLTLPLELAPVRSAFARAMSGSAAVVAQVAAAGSMRVEVLDTSGPVVTITFG